MNALIGIGALLLALVTGYLASVTFVPAFTFTMDPTPAGQLRGILFTVVMAAMALGSLWVAFRSFVADQRRAAR